MELDLRQGQHQLPVLTPQKIIFWDLLSDYRAMSTYCFNPQKIILWDLLEDKVNINFLFQPPKKLYSEI